MTDKIDEQLSALLDGELPAEQEQLLLRRLADDERYRHTLGRYGLIGDLARDSAVLTAAMNISDRVSEALADEGAESTVRDNYVPASTRTGVMGAGIAAAIAAVVMVNLADTGKASRDAELTVNSQVSAPHQHAHTEASGSPRLTRYLVAHAQFANVASRQLTDSHLVMSAPPALARVQ